MNKKEITIPFMLKLCFVRLPLAIASSIALNVFRSLPPLIFLARKAKMVNSIGAICLSVIDDGILVVRQLEKEDLTEEQVKKGRILADLNRMREKTLAMLQEVSNGES